MEHTTRHKLTVATAIAVAAFITISAVAAPLQQTSDADDWARVKASGKLLIGTSADYPPFEFYDSNSKLDGFDIALMQEIGKRLGVTVEFNDFAFEGVLNALRLKQVDAAIAGISVTSDRQQLVDFSNLYYVGEDAALVTATTKGDLKTAADMANKKIGVERGTTHQVWAQQNLVDQGLIKQTDLITFDDTDKLITDLRAGKVDIGLMGDLPAREFDRRFRDLRIAGSNFNEQRFAIAARKGSTLVPQLNGALLRMQSDGKFAELVKQYLQVPAEEVTPARQEAQVVNPPAAQRPAAAPACIAGMAFVADLNLDDKNMTAPPVMKPGQTFTKSWRLRNSGTCAWEPSYQLAFSYGNRPEARMGGSSIPVGKTVQPGETIDLSANLTAPSAYGVFQGFWDMRDQANRKFGQVTWVGIQVPDPNPPPTAAPPPAPPRSQPAQPAPSGQVNPNLRADAAWINAGQCTNIRWDVDNVSGVFFINGSNLQGVGGHDSRSVCPTSTANYGLRVVRRDNVTQDFPITINVNGGAASISFAADNANINAGQCTTLRWNVQNVRGVYLNNAGVAGQNAQQICPAATTAYTLRVVRNDGGEETRQVIVNVVGGAPTAIPVTPQP